jgi:HPt (histidine-containing phosphotransfer) domain-containing protein
VVSAIQSLDNKFEDALKNKKAKEQFDSALDLLEKEIKNQDKTADKNVDSILKELECK